jgi:succinyl-diaminopimelate desuccinylase
MDLEAIRAWIGEHREEMVELQREMTARPAIGPENDGQGEWQKARFLEDYVKGHELGEVEHFDCPDERVPEGTRPNLVVTIPGRREAPRTWVMMHLDVVPPGRRLEDGSWEGWDSDPFTLQRVDDVLIGRGVCDDQQPIASTLLAARALKARGVVPGNTVKLLLASDEESASERGMFYLLREHEELFDQDDALIVPDWGNEEGSAIEIAEKSVLWLKFTVQGCQAHSSRPDKAVNAFRAGARLLGLLDDGLRDSFDRVDHLYDLPRSTFEPTRHEANVPNINTVPPREVFCFDCRVLPHYSLDAVLAFVDAQCRSIDGVHATQTEMAVVMRQDAPPPTKPDAPVVEMLSEALCETRRIEPTTVGVGGMTVASPFREKGYQVAVWMTTNNTSHQANESCLVSHMEADAEVFACIFGRGHPSG